MNSIQRSDTLCRSWPWFSLALALVLGLTGLPASADGIAGYWLKTSDNRSDAVIEIYPNGEGGFDGRIARLEHRRFASGEITAAGRVPAELVGEIKRDHLNPDPELRSRPIEGLTLIEGFKPDGEGQWSDATIYNPEDGKTYKCTAMLGENGRELHVRGYIGFSLFGKTQTWERVESPDIFERRASNAD